MAAKAVKKAVRKAVRKKSAVRKANVGQESDLAARVRTLERRLLELQQNPLLALADVLVIEKGRNCNTVKVIGNLQIVNGMGKTDTTNGCGNLIVGYNEASIASPGARTGSHNVIVGRYHSHASYACLLTGERNFANANAPSSCVVGGSDSHVGADRSVVVGGRENNANSAGCVLVGGQDNGANGADHSVVVGGGQNRTAAPASSIFGGGGNTANSQGSTILGGVGLTTTMPNERIP
jgi:hypothetical protein